MENKCDQRLFKKDLQNLLNSDFVKNLTLLVDKRVFDLGFKISRSSKIILTSTEECLRLLKADSKKYICVTIGTSYFFPSIGDVDWVFYPKDEFKYPALKRFKNIFLAEIHCYCYNNSDYCKTIDKYYRISVYEINGANKAKTRKWRFENGKVIDENNLKSGEDLEDEVLSKNNFTGPGEYDAALNAEGWGFGGTTVKWGVSQAMGKYNLTFPEACRFLEHRGNLIPVK